MYLVISKEDCRDYCFASNMEPALLNRETIAKDYFDKSSFTIEKLTDLFGDWVKELEVISTRNILVIPFGKLEAFIKRSGYKKDEIFSKIVGIYELKEVNNV